MSKPRPVEIVKPSYKPTKAEIEEVVVLQTKEGREAAHRRRLGGRGDGFRNRHPYREAP